MRRGFQEAKTKAKALLDNAALAHPDFSRPFLLSVDASSNGLGAVLSQLAEGDSVARPIAFASKSLSYAQSRYCHKPIMAVVAKRGDAHN